LQGSKSVDKEGGPKKKLKVQRGKSQKRRIETDPQEEITMPFFLNLFRGDSKVSKTPLKTLFL